MCVHTSDVQSAISTAPYYVGGLSTQCWFPVKGVVMFISSLSRLKLMESVLCAKAREFMKDT